MTGWEESHGWIRRVDERDEETWQRGVDCKRGSGEEDGGREKIGNEWMGLEPEMQSRD